MSTGGKFCWEREGTQFPYQCLAGQTPRDPVPPPQALPSLSCVVRSLTAGELLQGGSVCVCRESPRLPAACPSRQLPRLSQVPAGSLSLCTLAVVWPTATLFSSGTFTELYQEVKC